MRADTPTKKRIVHTLGCVLRWEFILTTAMVMTNRDGNRLSTNAHLKIYNFLTFANLLSSNSGLQTKINRENLLFSKTLNKCTVISWEIVLTMLIMKSFTSRICCLLLKVKLRETWTKGRARYTFFKWYFWARVAKGGWRCERNGTNCIEGILKKPKYLSMKTWVLNINTNIELSSMKIFRTC